MRTRVALGESMKSRGYGAATHVLAQFGEGQGFLTEAKRRGLTVACDVNIAMSAEKIVIAEQARFPEWEDPALHWGETVSASDPSFRPSEAMLSSTDIYLCPSEFVRADLIENFGVQAERTRLVPYAIDERWFSVPNTPVPGRVLSVGSAGLRKGTHYLAMAAAQLKRRDQTIDIRVLGGVSERFRNKARPLGITLLGRIPRFDVQAEYRLADVFVLASLAEGSAVSTYEALAMGIPVIATVEAGSVVRHGVDGLIVPARDPEALTEAIESIVRDRNRREAMSVAARRRARDFTWEKLKEHLLRSLVAGPFAEGKEQVLSATTRASSAARISGE
ncbi:glycosyltransferase family 4 protein [Mesorhizobium sp.]|uniref:glycosyltransferase family 4 protein n=1 Tax=Mesorhizobium sp. TaxID=1871066 RepID=UPI00257E5B31|nr:glycosyltransferase family 4 protein [Mesorhizobium sp.]